MSKNNENKLVPNLRFPEFIREGDWKILPLSELSNEITEKTKGRKFKLMSITSGVGLVSQIEKFGKEIAGNSYDNYYVLSKGDFAYNKSSTKLYPEGEIAMLEKEENGAVPNSIFTCFSFDKNKIYPNFAKYPFINNMHGRWLKKFISVGARAHGALQVNSKDLFSIPFPYPSIKEQQKIASCLSSLDEVITAESQKLEMLKDHKKGLLQNLFPQEGETVPKLRFKEFEGSGEWLSDILKNVFTIFQGFAFSSNDSVSTGVRWLKIADVGIQQMNHLSPSYLPYEFKEKYENFLVKEGDYVIALTRPILNKKLKISKVDNTLHDSLLNQRVGKLVSNKCIDFVYYLIQTSKLVSSIEQNIAGSEPPNLSAQQIENIEVFIPPTIKEQQKIASCLYSIDELINAQNQKLETLKLHKKGLLQGLFPGVNET
ncbi:MAG TPA: restriction endonuclease subunit S [bacterium]|nr:restriction endonuclease subunit S [bacterium]